MKIQVLAREATLLALAFANGKPTSGETLLRGERASSSTIGGVLSTDEKDRSRQLQEALVCGGVAPCTFGANCVNNVCVCGDGWVPDPSWPGDPSLAAYFSCVDHNECLIALDNICPSTEKGGVCVDFDPPQKYRCYCNAGYTVIAEHQLFGATSCLKDGFTVAPSMSLTPSMLPASSAPSATPPIMSLAPSTLLAPSATPPTKSLAPSTLSAPSATPSVMSLSPSTLPASSAPSATPPITTILLKAVISGTNASVSSVSERYSQMIGGRPSVESGLVIPIDYASRPLVEIALLVDISGDADYVFEMLEVASITQSEEWQTAGVVSLSSSSDESSTFVLQVSACPETCGFQLPLSNAEMQAAELNGIDPVDLLRSTLSSGYCQPLSGECACIAGYGGSTCQVLCSEKATQLACDSLAACSWCQTTASCTTSSTERLDARTEDEIQQCLTCAELSGQAAFCLASPACSYCPSSGACSNFDEDSLEDNCRFSIVDTSPAHGEDNVALTRETVVYFSEPVDEASLVNCTISVKAQGQAILSTILHLSSDGRTITIFYDSALPANSDIRVSLSNAIRSRNGEHLLQRQFDLHFSTLGIIPVNDTYVCGRVFASGFQTLDNETVLVDIPISEVTISVDGAETDISVMTNDAGSFILGPVPSGVFFVHIDGRTSTRSLELAGQGAYFPSVGKSWTAIARKMTNVGTIFLPLIGPDTLTPLSAAETTVIQFPESVIEVNPTFIGVTIDVAPGLLINPLDPSGTNQSVGIAPVQPNRLPGTLPLTLRLPLVITVQTVGGSNFDQPAPACFPNLPDPLTNETLPPKAPTALWSFNHDTGRFEVVGPATVTNDGSLACSDPGFGILAPGWHGVTPGTPARPSNNTPACDTKSPCCNSSDASGGSADGPLTALYRSFNDPNSINSLFGCAVSTSAKVGKKWVERIKCAKSLTDTAFNWKFSRNIQDVLGALGKYASDKWSIVNNCFGGESIITILNPAVAAGLDVSLGLYGCARSLQKKVEEACKTSVNFQCDYPNVCAANKKVSGPLKVLDNVITGLKGINLIRRRAATEGSVNITSTLYTQEQLDAILIENYFNNSDQYLRTSPNALINRIDAIENVLQINVDNSTIVDMANEIALDFDVLKRPIDDLLLDIADVIPELLGAIAALLKELRIFVIVASSGGNVSLARNLESSTSGAELCFLNKTTNSTMNGESQGSEDETENIDGEAAPNGGVRIPPSPRELFIYLRLEEDDELRFKTTSGGGVVGITLPPLQEFLYMAYNLEENLFGFTNGRTSRSGVPSKLPDLPMVPVDEDILQDFDGDGLCDICEFVIGTDPNEADSDSDGTGDLQELLAGTNPLDGIAVGNGVVAIAPLPSGRGSPTSIQMSESTIFVIMSRGGIAVYDAFNALQPSLVSVISSAVQFSVVSASQDRVLGLTNDQRLLLFSGQDYQEVLDVTARFARGLGFTITSLHLGGEIVAIGNAQGRVTLFDSSFSAQLQTLDTGTMTPVSHIELSASGSIFVFSGGTLFRYDPDSASHVRYAALPRYGTSLEVQDTWYVNVGSSRAYVTDISGRLSAVSMETGSLIGSSTSFPVGSFDFAIFEPNGGKSVVLTASSVEIWNVDDVVSPRFVSSFPISGSPRNTLLAAGNGFVYVASTSGLNVVNINGADIFGIAPIVSNFTVTNKGIQVDQGAAVEEGQILNLIAEVKDDVAVRNVLFSVNGTQIKVDSSFPHFASVLVPHFSGAPELVASVSAWDIAGNMAAEVTVSLTIVPDITPPSVLMSFPAVNSSITVSDVKESLFNMTFDFSEVPDGLPDPSKFAIVMRGNFTNALDRQNYTFTVNPVIARVTVSIPANELPQQGNFQAVLSQGFVRDLRGNPSSELFVPFEVSTSSDVRTAIAVIDESNMSQGYANARWDQFRAAYPNRPFCLLRPVKNDFLNIPVNFDGMFSLVARDGGNVEARSDWFSICGLNQLDGSIRKVDLFIDTSGSMNLNTVRASYDLFLVRVSNANLEIKPVFNKNELWIDPFFVSR